MNRARKETAVVERKTIVKLVCQGKTYREVREIVSRSFSSVRTVINKWKNNGTLINKIERGRKKNLSSKNDRYIRRQIEKEPKKPTNNLTAEVYAMIERPISKETIRRTLQNQGFSGRISRKKPFISDVNRKKRLEFAKQYINHGPEFWKHVIFSDESKFNIFGSDGKQIVWRKPNTELDKKNLQYIVKRGGGNVMVWGCMAAGGVGNLEFIDTTLDKYVYLGILKRNLRFSATKLGLPEVFWFQQDNDPKHTSYIVKFWLLFNAPKQFKTPPQSPVINSIEHLWSLLEQRIRNTQ